MIYNKFLLIKSSGILLSLIGAILMFYGIGPLPIRIIFGILGIALIANSPNIIKIKKN